MPTDRELGAFHGNAINEHLTRRSVALMLFTASSSDEKVNRYPAASIFAMSASPTSYAACSRSTVPTCNGPIDLPVALLSLSAIATRRLNVRSCSAIWRRTVSEGSVARPPVGGT
jgi:hypothetical protein